MLYDGGSRTEQWLLYSYLTNISKINRFLQVLAHVGRRAHGRCRRCRCGSYHARPCHCPQRRDLGGHSWRRVAVSAHRPQESQWAFAMQARCLQQGQLEASNLALLARLAVRLHCHCQGERAKAAASLRCGVAAEERLPFQQPEVAVAASPKLRAVVQWIVASPFASLSWATAQSCQGWVPEQACFQVAPLFGPRWPAAV